MWVQSNMQARYFRYGYDIAVPLPLKVNFEHLALISAHRRKYFVTFKVRNPRQMECTGLCLPYYTYEVKPSSKYFFAWGLYFVMFSPKMSTVLTERVEYIATMLNTTKYEEASVH